MDRSRQDATEAVARAKQRQRPHGQGHQGGDHTELGPVVGPGPGRAGQAGGTSSRGQDAARAQEAQGGLGSWPRCDVVVLALFLRWRL